MNKPSETEPSKTEENIEKKLQKLTKQFCKEVTNIEIVFSLFNAFPANVPILYPLKTPKNLWFSSILGCIKWEHLPDMS